MEYLSNIYFLVALTFVVYIGFQYLQRRTRLALLNPILFAIIVVIAFLQITGIEYSTYSEAGGIIEFWLKPAVVAPDQRQQPETSVDRQASL